MKNQKTKLIVATLITAASVVIFFKMGKSQKVTLSPGNIEIPHNRTINWNDTSLFYDSIVSIWAQKTLEYGPEQGKVDNPRILLAQLHSRSNLAETNQLILGMKPWGVSGSTWALNKLGDYDFTLTVLTSILWQFGDRPELLHQETLAHLLDVLLVEEGKNYRGTAPRTLGLFPETENHLLMTEGSRYLKNRWLALHGDTDPNYDNIGNGMESKILALLVEMNTNGLYEFNSMPYIGYTITALLNLEAYASEEIRQEARDMLDYMNFCYAVGSFKYKHFPPMRRRYERASWHQLSTDYHSVFMKAWMSFYPGAETNFDIANGEAHAIIGACMPYRPADQISQLIFEKGEGYFVKIGHGLNASPEIYAAGKNYLLSAGGTNRGKSSEIIARPITLFLDDEAKTLEEAFHLAGPGTDFMEWNNTGVYKGFACAAGPVAIPEGHQPIVKSGYWAVYAGGENLHIAVYSSEKLGILALFEDQDAKSILQSLAAANPDQVKLKTKFQFPGASLIEYDPNASKDKWVITKVDQVPVDREYDTWPLFSGDFDL